MLQAEAAIAKGYAAYQQGDLKTARATLEPIPHPQAWHLLGLVERAAGRYEQARKWLDQAQIKDPQNPEIANNQGRVDFDAGNWTGAETCFRRALQLRANWPPALAGLARSLNKQERWREAYPVWIDLLKLTPSDRVARYDTAMAALEIGFVEQAFAEFDGLIRAGLTDPAVYFMRGRSRVELSDLDAGIDDFRRAWSEQKSGHTLKNLANTLWMAGDQQGFHDLISDAPDELSSLKLYLLAKSGDSAGALAMWDALSEPFSKDPYTLAAKANIHKSRGEAEDALSAAAEAHKVRPNHAGIDDALVSAQLMLGRYDEALKTLKPWRASHPHVQSWIALEATALRLARRPEYKALVAPDAFIQAFQLPVPQGFDSIEAFNTALIDAIAPNQSFSQQPLDQTLRAGTQTARDLVHVNNPIIQAYLRALDAPIQSYLSSIGIAPDHPFLSRNTGKYQFNGCWSVTLQGQGHHVNHVHPNGWISSAYYARVPEETRSGDGKAGWIKFGEPPFKTEPALAPEKWVQPSPGTLVLFPSYMWHGTEPIHDGSERVTVPFDLVPG